MAAKAKGGIELPGSLLPIWPIDMNVFFPIVPGLEAHGGIKVDGGVGIQFDGAVTKEGKDPWQVAAKNKNTAMLRLEVNAGLTAGSGYIVGVSGSLFAGIESKATANTDLTGGFTIDTQGLHPETTKLGYDLEAILKTDIGANVKAHALGIFHKKLYEIKFAEYELGSYTFKGFTTLNEKGKPELVEAKPQFEGKKDGGKAKSLEEAGLLTEVPDEKMIEQLVDDNRVIMNSGDKKREVANEKVEAYTQRADEIYVSIEQLLQEKLDMEGNLTEDEYQKKLDKKIKKFFSTKKKRLAAKEEKRRHQALLDEITALKTELKQVESVGGTLREQAKDPEKLEKNEIKLGNILEQVDEREVSLKTTVEKIHQKVEDVLARLIGLNDPLLLYC